MFELVSAGLQLFGAYNSYKSGEDAGNAALAVGAKNATIIERDIDIANRQKEILQRNLERSNERKMLAFGAYQAGARNATLGQGMTSRGTPQDIFIENVKEFNYELAVDRYNTEIALLEQDDLIEETKLRAEVSRMGGQAEKSALRAQGTSALITGAAGGIGTIADAGGMDYLRDVWTDLTT